MKKDLQTLGSYFPTGQFKIVDVFVEGAAKESQQLLVGTSGYNIDLLKTELGRVVAKTISNEFIKKEVEGAVTKKAEFLNNLIERGIKEGRYYEYQDFNYYQADNVAAKEEATGVSLSFISKVEKNFKDVGSNSKIEYIYIDDIKEDSKTDTYLIGYKPLDGTILFIGGTISMPRQVSLL